MTIQWGVEPLKSIYVHAPSLSTTSWEIDETGNIRSTGSRGGGASVLAPDAVCMRALLSIYKIDIDTGHIPYPRVCKDIYPWVKCSRSGAEYTVCKS